MTDRSPTLPRPLPTTLRSGGGGAARDGSRKLRIVHLSKHCQHGNGSVHVAVDLACLQARSGHEVTFASGGGTYVGMLEQHGVRHWTLPQDQARKLGLLKSLAALAAHCRGSRPDILHAHMMGGTGIGYLASRVSAAALVTTVHNSFDRHSALMRVGDRVVAVSHAERDQLLERGWPSDKIDVVWNGPANSPRHGIIANDRPVEIVRPSVTAICGLHGRKGLTELIDACASVFPGHPDWRLSIAGEGPDRQQLAERAASLGLGDRVTFLGYVANPRTVYDQTDIFVLASKADPGSLSIGEARDAGCAIVATSVGGTPEMLEFGRAGRLVPPSDVGALAAALAELMGDPNARAALGRSARQGAAIFDVSRLGRDYESVYRSAILARTRRRPRPVVP